MGETSVHARLVRYLMEVLTWLFWGQQCAIYDNLNFYQTRNPEEHPLAPDIAVIKGVDYIDVTSWKVGRTGPPPQGWSGPSGLVQARTIAAIRSTETRPNEKVMTHLLAEHLSAA